MVPSDSVLPPLIDPFFKKEADYEINPNTAKMREELLRLRDSDDTPTWSQRRVGVVPENATSSLNNATRLVDGKPFYAMQRKGTWQVVWGGWRSDRETSEPHGINITDGIVHYSLKTEKGERAFVYGGCRSSLPECDDLSTVCIVNKVPAYAYHHDDTYVLVREGREEKLHYDSMELSTMKWVNGRSLCMASCKGNRVIARGNRLTNLHTRRADSFQYAEGKLLYVLTDPDREYHRRQCVVWGDEEYESHFWIEDLSFVAMKPFYRVTINLDGDLRQVLMHGHEKFADLESLDASNLAVIGNRIAFAERKHQDPNPYSVIWGRARSPQAYDHVFSLHAEGKKLVFGARKGRELYRVSARFLVR